MTATAAPRAIATPVKSVTVDLVPAVPSDFQEYAGKDSLNRDKWKRRIGMIYWIFSSDKNEFDTSPYIFSESTDAEELYDFLKREMVFVARSPFVN